MSKVCALCGFAIKDDEEVYNSHDDDCPKKIDPIADCDCDNPAHQYCDEMVSEQIGDFFFLKEGWEEIIGLTNSNPMTVVEWNKKYPVGTPVRYRPVFGGLHYVDTKTVGKAMIDDGIAIVKIEYANMSVSLSAVFPHVAPIVQSLNDLPNTETINSIPKDVMLDIFVIRNQKGKDDVLYRFYKAVGTILDDDMSADYKVRFINVAWAVACRGISLIEENNAQVKAPTLVL